MELLQKYQSYLSLKEYKRLFERYLLVINLKLLVYCLTCIVSYRISEFVSFVFGFCFHKFVFNL